MSNSINDTVGMVSQIVGGEDELKDLLTNSTLSKEDIKLLEDNNVLSGNFKLSDMVSTSVKTSIIETLKKEPQILEYIYTSDSTTIKKKIVTEAYTGYEAEVIASMEDMIQKDLAAEADGKDIMYSGFIEAIREQLSFSDINNRIFDITIDGVRYYIKDDYLNSLRTLEGDNKYNLYSLNALKIEKALSEVMTPNTPYVRKDDSEKEYEKEVEENSLEINTRIQSFSFLLIELFKIQIEEFNMFCHKYAYKSIVGELFSVDSMVAELANYMISRTSRTAKGKKRNRNTSIGYYKQKLLKRISKKIGDNYNSDIETDILDMLNDTSNMYKIQYKLSCKAPEDSFDIAEELEKARNNDIIISKEMDEILTYIIIRAYYLGFTGTVSLGSIPAIQYALYQPIDNNYIGKYLFLVSMLAQHVKAIGGFIKMIDINTWTTDVLPVKIQLDKEIFPEKYTALEQNEAIAKKIEDEIAASKEEAGVDLPDAGDTTSNTETVII